MELTKRQITVLIAVLIAILISAGVFSNEDFRQGIRFWDSVEELIEVSEESDATTP